MESTHKKYVIEITEVVAITKSEIQQFVTSEAPTEIKSEEQYNRGKPVMAKTYENRAVDVTREDKQSVYRQEVETLDLIAVINAVNAAK